MRVVIVGPAPERARARAELDGAVDVVGEHETLGEARAAGHDADATILVESSSQRGVRLRGERSWPGPNDEPDTFAEPLTAREVQVLELLAEGLPNKSIAERLGISDQTVKFHVASIAGKLGAHNRTETVRLAVRHGLL